SCPWLAKVVPLTSSLMAEPQPSEDGEMPDTFESPKITGDANFTMIDLNITAPEGQRIRISEIRIRVLESAPAPTSETAAVVGVQRWGCGAPPTEVNTHALIRPSDHEVTAVPDKGSEHNLPQVIADDDEGLVISLKVGTATCDCRWFPVVHWSVAGKDEVAQEVRPREGFYRTVAAAHLDRYAWKQDHDRPLPGGRFRWVPTEFPEELLVAWPDE
ncbi:hypothetical protein, partial [Micromonospora qiuiae]|uniref:hypothetical protein n=1 Tax=Micromonospora qiuiae TaxID=502268 RepID=UPI00194F9F66